MEAEWPGLYTALLYVVSAGVPGTWIERFPKFQSFGTWEGRFPYSARTDSYSGGPAHDRKVEDDMMTRGRGK